MARKALLATGLALVGGYAVAVRPRLVRWGATDEELRRTFPGGDLIPGGRRGATMAVTIDGPPSEVWPWLVQMGVDRAGWYSWDRLDNFGRRSAERIHPEWQAIAVGDHLTAMPDGSEWWEVAALEPERFLCLRMSLDLRGRPFDPTGPRPRYSTDSTWAFLLDELPGGRSRLVVSGYWSLQPRWLQPLASVAVLEPSHWIMQMRQFRNLRRHVEQGPAHRGEPAGAAQTARVATQSSSAGQRSAQSGDTIS
jgi:proline iminopeptidase